MKPINLNRREKYAVAGAGGCILIILILQLVVFPIKNKRERLSGQLSAKALELEEIRSLQTEYLSLQQQADRARKSLSNRENNFSLYRFLENLARVVDIRVASMKESSSSLQNDEGTKVFMVELKLQSVTMEQLTQYLHQVEYSGNNLNVKRMVISEKDGYIDVSLQVETIEA